MPAVTPAEVYDRAVAHVDAVGLDLHVGVAPREPLAARPVRGRAAAVEQPRAASRNAPLHTPGDPARARGHARGPRRSAGVAQRGAHALAARDEQRVDRAAHVAERGIRHQLAVRTTSRAARGARATSSSR